MSSHGELTVPAVRRQKSRKSIGNMASPDERGIGDKENVTADVGALASREKRAASADRPSKKSRSKSIGPGGLDALKDTAGNRRQSMQAPLPRSILKPTMPIPEIPARAVKSSAGKTKTPTPPQSGKATHPPRKGASSGSDATLTGAQKLAKAFQTESDSAAEETRVAVRTEEEQQAAAKEREEFEKEQRETELKERREARRKSLANRRVSFAPEATLHTWDVVEYMQESTSSSASTNTTRRASSVAGELPHPTGETDAAGSEIEVPSTPPEQSDEQTDIGSPDDQRDLHQKKRRRESVIPPMNFNNPDDETIASSPFGGSDAIGSDDGMSLESDGDMQSDDDGTMMSIDQDATNMSAMSHVSQSTGSSARLDQALRLATQQADTQRFNYQVENATEEEDNEVLASFAPRIKRTGLEYLSAMDDQENVNPFSPAFRAGTQHLGNPSRDDDSDADMTMDMTHAGGRILPDEQDSEDMTMEMDITAAIGGILPSFSRQAAKADRRKSVNRRQSTRRVSSGEKTGFGDETMDLTRAIGGIQSSAIQPKETAPSDDEDMTMDLTRAVGGVLAPNKPSAGQSRRKSMGLKVPKQDTRRVSVESSAGDDSMDMTMAVGGILPPAGEAAVGAEETMGMDMTKAYGGILPPNRSPAKRSNAKQIMEMEADQPDITYPSLPAITDRQPEVTSAEETMGMDMTKAFGGILPSTKPTIPVFREPQPEATISAEETMGMDMTKAFGGIIPSTQSPQKRSHPKRAMPSVPVLINPQPQAESADETMGMDMTKAFGGIIPSTKSSETRTHAKQVMEMEADVPDVDLLMSVLADVQPQAKPEGRRSSAVAPATGTPGLAAFKGKGLRRSGDAKLLASPKSAMKAATPIKKAATPVKKPTTPSKQATPVVPRPKTPTKATPAKDVTQSPSPNKLPKPENKVTRVSKSPSPVRSTTPRRLFNQDKKTGASTPSIVLAAPKAKGRRSSGLGIDKPGLGSPRIAALLDKRGSLGKEASPLMSRVDDIKRELRFDDARKIEDQLDQERQDDEDRESGRRVLEREADNDGEEKDATLNLTKMIESLTPKKKSLKGRKSLHTGTARGILGKRPVELDSDDEDDNGGVKRLKGLQESPVKSVRLHAPPSKEETTGQFSRSLQKAMGGTDQNALVTPTVTLSPVKSARVTTPRSQERFKDAAAGSGTVEPIDYNDKEPVENPEYDEGDLQDDRIHLQEFLNLTSIRFMELTTTKRRHTAAPASFKDQKPEADDTFESCVVAGACTVPMLELFQHSCRELKRYISEGRSIVHEIEAETFEENPALFQEYISAPPDVKVLMDNQFKNVKTHARLQSKAMWYEWRMKLLENVINDGLNKTLEGLQSDDEVFEAQQKLLDSVLPSLIEQHDSLAKQESDLQIAAEELANCDQTALNDARQQLLSVDSDIENKKRMIAELESQMMEAEQSITAAAKTKQTYMEDIKEAEKVREECRGWSAEEVQALKAKVDALEKKHGWTITGVSGTVTSMTFRREIELVFDAVSFLSHASPSTSDTQMPTRIDLWYIGASRDFEPSPATPEKEFFLQNIRDHIRALPQATTGVTQLLEAVSVAWTNSTSLLNDVRLINLTHHVEVNKTSDSSIVVNATMLLKELGTKVNVGFDVEVQSTVKGLDFLFGARVNVKYGERFNEGKMGEFLLERIGGRVAKRGCMKGSMNGAVEELRVRLLARGKK